MPVPMLCRRAPFPCSFSYANVLNVKPLTFSGPGTPSAALAQGQLGCFTRGCSCWDAATPSPAPDLLRTRYTLLTQAYAGLAAGLQPMSGTSDANCDATAPCHTLSRRKRE